MGRRGMTEMPACNTLAELLTIRNADGAFVATPKGDVPVECHDGSLNEFASMPTPDTCEVVALTELVSDPHGSLTRSFPSELAHEPPPCANIEVPGLPRPMSIDEGMEQARAAIADGAAKAKLEQLVELSRG